MADLPTSWRAAWVCPTAEPTPAGRRPAYRLRGTFVVAGPISRATLYATAHGIYEAELNGVRVADEELTPGYTEYAHHTQVQTPDALMGNWFAKYWLKLEGQAREDYLGLFAGLDPVSHTAHLGSHLLFQWAGEDTFVGQGVRDAYAARSPDARVDLYERAGHQLTDPARADRLGFLSHELGLLAP